MNVDKKILAAQYHLANMKREYVTNEQHFIYETEAFLAKIRSIPDVMLEDYNQKFGLGIPLSNKLYPRTFESQAAALTDPTVRKNALAFFTWWTGEMAKFQSDPFISLFFDKRHVSIHRIELHANLKKVTITASINMSASVTVTKVDELDSDTPEKPEQDTSPAAPSHQPTIEDSKIDWFFNDYPAENILVASQKLLEIMRQFVCNTKARFPIS